MDETALPGFEVNSWYGLCAPAGTPAPILDKVHADLVAVLHMPEIQQRFKDLVIEVAPTSREEFAQFISAETARWARVIKAAGHPAGVRRCPICTCGAQHRHHHPQITYLRSKHASRWAETFSASSIIINQPINYKRKRRRGEQVQVNEPAGLRLDRLPVRDLRQ